MAEVAVVEVVVVVPTVRVPVSHRSRSSGSCKSRRSSRTSDNRRSDNYRLGSCRIPNSSRRSDSSRNTTGSTNLRSSQSRGSGRNRSHSGRNQSDRSCRSGRSYHDCQTSAALPPPAPGPLANAAPSLTPAKTNAPRTAEIDKRLRIASSFSEMEFFVCGLAGLGCPPPSTTGRVAICYRSTVDGLADFQMRATAPDLRRRVRQTWTIPRRTDCLIRPWVPGTD